MRQPFLFSKNKFLVHYHNVCLTNNSFCVIHVTILYFIYFYYHNDTRRPSNKLLMENQPHFIVMNQISAKNENKR